MLVPYYEIEKVYNDEYNIWEGEPILCIAGEMPKDYIATHGWDSIEQFCNLPNQRWYRVEKRHKGRIFCDPMRTLEKEWRKPNFTIKHSHTYFAANPSIMDILNYPNVELAAQYLRERGINIMDSIKK